MQVHKKELVRLPSGCVKGGYKGISWVFFVSVFRFHCRPTNDLPDQRLHQRPPDHISSLSGSPRDQTMYGVVVF